MKKFIFIAVSILFGYSTSFSQSLQYEKTYNSNEILGKLKKLNSFGTVMYLAAHPDDENTRLISYLVHERNVRTIYYSLTRGDGGQNIIGNEQGKYLGLIRTLEMNEARKLDGAEQIYSSAIDFGFSKNPEEVFTKWDKQQLIKEIKEAFQAYRPDVVILRFPTTGEGGHGQHTASAILAAEAYKELAIDAKSDPTIFVPTRILFNAFNFGDRSTQKEDQLKITINQFNPLLGKSYGQLAGESRSMHKSQGAGTPQSFGIYKEYFQHLGGIEANTDILDNVPTTWTSIGMPKYEQKINNIINNFDPLKPQTSIPSLIRLSNELQKEKNYNNNIQLQYQSYLIDQCIVACSQITIEALADKPSYYKGDSLKVKLNIAARASNVTLHNIYVSIDQSAIYPQQQLVLDSLYQYTLANTNNAWEYNADEPYWLAEHEWSGIDNSKDIYHFKAMKNGKYYHSIANNNNVSVELSIHDKPYHIWLPLNYKRLDPLRGDVVNPIRLDQSVKIDLPQSLVIIDSTGTIPVKITTLGIVNSPLDVIVKQEGKIMNWGTLYPQKTNWDTLINIAINQKDLIQNYVNITISSPDTNRSIGTINSTTKVIKYDHIPETQYSVPSRQKLVIKDWTTKVKHIGYIQGADDLVDDVLKSLDFNVVNLNKTDFQNSAYIQSFDAIVVGIRAYNVNDDIAAIHPLLMNYIKNGGTVIVQYNTDKNLKTAQLGPYPFSISRNRITLEDAPTTILNPQHRLLNYPNKIDEKDWHNWIQERGIYYPTDWDNNYQTLIQHQEFEEKELKSGILYTPFGKGHYIYTPLVFFRQLPDGNAGAIKLFINLLSVGK